MLHWLGAKPSCSRPRVSDDNAYAESLFRTAKYRPEFPARGFEDLEAAGFVRWYNEEHLAELLSLDGVASVFFTADFVTISKSPDGSWDAITPEATAILERHFGD